MKQGFARKHWILIFTVSILLVSSTHGQNEVLDSLRRQADANPKNLVFKAEQCNAFADFGMIDSAKQCLQFFAHRVSPSPEFNLINWLTKASLNSQLGDFKGMIAAYDSAFQIINRSKPSFRIQQRVYLKALDDYKLYVYCDEAVLMAEHFLNQCLSAQADSMLMHAYLYRAQASECVGDNNHLSQSDIESARALKDIHPEWSGDFFMHLGNVHLYLERAPEAISNFLDAEQAYLSSGQAAKLFELYYSFSDAYDFINDLERSKYYVLKTLQIPGGPPIKELAHHYNNIAWSYYRVNELDSSLFFLTKSIHTFRQITPGNLEIAYPYGNLGLIYRKQGALDSAEVYSQMAKALFQALNYPTGVAEALNNLAQIDLTRGKIDTAEARYSRALDIAQDYADELEQLNAIEGLISIYKQQQPDRALTYYDSFLALKLSIQGKEEALKVMQVEVDHYEQRNREKIARLQYEAERQALELERKNLRLINISIGLVLALILAGFFYYYWFQHLRMTRSLQDLNEVNQRIISMISHDFRGPLNNIKLSLELLQADDMDQAEFHTLTKDLYRQSSDVSLMFDSFVGWAMAQKDGYEPSRINFKWAEVIEEVESISKPLADLKNIRIYIRSHSKIDAHTDRMAVSLIFRNLLSNAIKYSHRDSSIEISYEQENTKVITRVKDHGIGMSMEQLQNMLRTERNNSTLGTNNEYGAGLGLRMVIKYITSLKGTINAYSKEGEGTEFIVTLPIEL